MFLRLLYPYIKFIVATLYPSYKTWKALKRKDETTRRRWMKYWVSFAAFQTAEFGADLTLLYIVPFYFEIKLLMILWIVLGTKLFFDSIVNRELTKREKAIDKFLTKIAKARDEIIATVWFEVSRGSIMIFSQIMTGSLSVISASNNNVKGDCDSPIPSLATSADCEEFEQIVKPRRRNLDSGYDYDNNNEQEEVMMVD